MDKYIRIEVLSQTHNPNTLVYRAMHQDYSENYVFDEIIPDERSCGEIAIKRLLEGNRGHFGCLEHPAISFNAGWFPHSTMQQLRTHRVGISFDVQSGRYTGDRIIKAANEELNIEEVFYLRPLGTYTDRSGKRYEYDEEIRFLDLEDCVKAAKRYATKIKNGYSEEHARGTIPFDIRQHWVVSFNMRSLMHLLDLRWKKDAQLECQWFCELIEPHFMNWSPEIYDWYLKNRAKKALLAP